MKKTQALELLGGSAAAAAERIGISVQAVSQWPDDLPQRIADRVQAALWRMAREQTVPVTPGRVDRGDAEDAKVSAHEPENHAPGTWPTNFGHNVDTVVSEQPVKAGA